MKRCLVTGSSGLIGSEVAFFSRRPASRSTASTTTSAPFSSARRATRAGTSAGSPSELPGFVHHELDIRDRAGVLALVEDGPARRASSTPPRSPVHDRAAAIPFDDFDTNAVGTLNLLEAARQACPESPFVHMSTNKVYGDAPNRIALDGTARPAGTTPTRPTRTASPETFTIDQSKHSLFGASKVAADVMVQEYGRYFGLPTCCPARRLPDRAEPHRASSCTASSVYLVKCNLEGREYRVFGYKGKQVRDNIHSLDVARFMHAFCRSPARGRGLQSRRRQGQLVLDPRGLQDRGKIHRQGAGAHLRRGEPRRRPHLLLQRPAQNARALPELGHHRSLEETIGEIVAAWRRRKQDGQP